MKKNRVWVVEFRKTKNDEWRVIEIVGVDCGKKAHDHAKIWRIWHHKNKYRATPYEPVKRGKR